MKNAAETWRNSIEEKGVGCFRLIVISSVVTPVFDFNVNFKVTKISKY